MNQIDILFMGYCVSADETKNLSGVSIAGNKMQLSILKELRDSSCGLHCITVYPVAAFPKDKRLLYKKTNIMIDNNLSSLRIPFINLPILKQCMQMIGNYKAGSSLIKLASSKEKKLLIYTFNMYPQIGLPAIWLKKKYGLEIVCLLADLPIDDNYSRRGLMKILLRFFNEITRKTIRKIDKSIVLNENAWKIFAPQSKHIVIDGGIDLDEIPTLFGTVERKKNLLYSGALSDYSGIKELIDAVNLLGDEIELDIYGDGKLKDYVISMQNKKVHYHGKVSNDVVMQKQREAYFLVNPRPVEDAIAQVTFPSKIFEYMLSGTPIISTRLNGFSSDYDDLMYFCNSSRPDELAYAIKKAINIPYSQSIKMAEKARDYVISNKTWKFQVKKMMDFMF